MSDRVTVCNVFHKLSDVVLRLLDIASIHLERGLTFANALHKCLKVLHLRAQFTKSNELPWLWLIWFGLQSRHTNLRCHLQTLPLVELWLAEFD